jgi:hypothetical protein
MMILDNKLEIGQTVYLKTDKEQLARIVTALTVRVGSILYALGCGATESWHYDFEISLEKDVKVLIEN